MMKKNDYISPAIQVFTLQTSRMLIVSGDESSMPWSGDHAGTAGPGEIDDQSTFDSVARETDFDDFNPFEDF